MQISKCFLVVCAAAYCTALLPLRAADADTDAKLREALEQKLNELQTQPATATPQPSATTPSPKTPTPPATAPASITPAPADSEAIAKARQAMREKMSELQAQPGGRPTPPAQWTPPPMTKPSPSVAQPTPAPPPAVAQPSPAVAPPVDQESIAKARDTLHKQMKELETQPPAATPAPASSPKVAKGQSGQKPVEAKSQETAGKSEVQPNADKLAKKPAKGALSFPPIQAPPTAISADKETRLAELLRKYKADEITPEEYHQQRAKILSEP